MPLLADWRIAVFTPLLLCITLPALGAQSPDHLLLRDPAVSKTQICFEYANDLWIVSREGGEARRLTTNPGHEGDAHFSPDGTQIAFTGEYEGNVDVYAVPAAGGVPRRLTYHPGQDIARGWTPDGKRILFSSHRDSFADSGQLYTMALDAREGGPLPVPLPLPLAEDGSYSADGSHIVYEPFFHWQEAWKRYHGGQSLKLWIADLHNSSIVPIPRESSNDFNPMWVGDKIYFLSDRNGNVSLWSYDTGSKKVSEAVKNDGLDFKSASAASDAIVYEQFGTIHLLDLKSGKSRRVPITVSADLAEVPPRLQKLSNTKIEISGI